MKKFTLPVAFGLMGKFMLISPRALRVARMFALFLPSVLIVLSGALLLYSPRLALMVLAMLLVVCGAALACLAVYLLRVKKKVEAAIKQFQGRVVLQGVTLRAEAPLEQEEPGKIIFH